MDKSNGRYHKAADLDVSILLYLNDDYTGVELTFTRLNYTYRPTTGDMVVFPSGTLFKHRAHTVKKPPQICLVELVNSAFIPQNFPQSVCLLESPAIAKHSFARAIC